MNQETIKRIKSFAWGMSGWTGVAAAAYLANIADVREIDIYKLATIVVVAACGYFVNQVTKILNS